VVGEVLCSPVLLEHLEALVVPEVAVALNEHPWLSAVHETYVLLLQLQMPLDSWQSCTRSRHFLALQLEI